MATNKKRNNSSFSEQSTKYLFTIICNNAAKSFKFTKNAKQIKNEHCFNNETYV